MELKCKEYNIEYKITNETYTSKMCCLCSEISKIDKNTKGGILCNYCGIFIMKLFDVIT